MHGLTIALAGRRALMHIKGRAAQPGQLPPMDESLVREALRSVEDPEAGMSIVDLGLVYAIEASPGRVRVEMTMTSPACPAAPYLVDEAAAAVRSVAPDGTEVSVELVWEPPWTPERMSAEAQSRFGWSP
jgi:metal-sulfur cluster biosynthetic enzyme